MMNELSLLDELLNGECGLFSTMGNPAFTPDVDVVQTKDAYTISMDLPGKTEKDVDISLKDNVLTIASVQQEEKKIEDKTSKNEDKAKKQEDAESDENDSPRYLLRERRISTFSRSFKLPRDIDVSAVNATFANGVLEITVPRKAEEEPKKIAIRVA